MFLLFTASCGNREKDIVKVVFNPETTYTMKATDISSLISDSGVTRYRMNAKEWLVFSKAAEPYQYFPQGVYIEIFDTLFNPVASIKADTAYYWEKKGLIKLINNIEVENLEGEHFETNLLYWDEQADRVWSDQFIKIRREDKTIMGVGFESNRNMTKYRIFNSSGEFPVQETPTDSMQTTGRAPDQPTTP